MSQADVNRSLTGKKSGMEFLGPHFLPVRCVVYLSTPHFFQQNRHQVCIITMARRYYSLVGCLFVLLLVTANVNAWTPQGRTKSSLIATSAALPVVQWVAVSHAIDSATPVVSSTTAIATADALQIPILAAYCTMAFWFIPKQVKKLKNNSWRQDS